MWGTTTEYLTNAISKAKFGTLDKVKDHPERNKAAGEAAQTFVSALGMALSKFQVGAKDGARRLEWPDSLDTAILGADRKLTALGIQQLQEGNCTWALVTVCDAACVTQGPQDRKGGATSAEQEARICMLEEELHKLKSHVTDTVEVRQELQTVKIATNCESKASMVVEQLENKLKLGNLEASVHGFSKVKSRPENLKAIMTHLAGLQLTTRLSHVSGECIQPNPGAKQKMFAGRSLDTSKPHWSTKEIGHLHSQGQQETRQEPHVFLVLRIFGPHQQHLLHPLLPRKEPFHLICWGTPTRL